MGKNNLLPLIFLLSLLASCSLDTKKDIKEDFLDDWNQISINKLKIYKETCENNNMVFLSFSRAFKEKLRYKVLKKHKYNSNQIIEFFETYQNEKNNYCAIFINNKIINYKIDLSNNFEISIISNNHNHAINLENISLYRNACDKNLKIVCDDSFNGSGKVGLYSKVIIKNTSIEVMKQCMEIGLIGQIGNGVKLESNVNK